MVFVQIGEETGASLHDILVCLVKISSIPRVGDVTRMAGKVQKLVDLVLRVIADNPVDIPYVHGIHAEDVVVGLVIFAGELDSISVIKRHALLPELGDRAVMDAVPNIIRAGGTGGNVKFIGDPLLLYHVDKNELRHRGTTDIAVADE